MEILSRSLARVATAIVVLLEWCWLPMVVAQARGLGGVDEAWGMLGMVTLPIPLILALGLTRGKTMAVQSATSLAVAAAPSLYYGFVR